MTFATCSKLILKQQPTPFGALVTNTTVTDGPKRKF
jgi:hypothetical protein